jgi:ubiquitin-protein ligase
MNQSKKNPYRIPKMKKPSIIDDLLEDDKKVVKAEKKKYVKPILVPVHDELWSDEESDYQIHLPAEPKPPNVTNSDHRSASSKIFSGLAKTNYNREILNPDSEFKSPEFICDYPLPSVAPHVVDILGEETIKLIWKEFVDHGSDETELLLSEHIPAIARNVNIALGYQLPFDRLQLEYANDEYTDFKFITQSLAQHRNEPGVVVPVRPKVVQLPPCCASIYCQFHKWADSKYNSNPRGMKPNFRLDVIYRRVILDRKGIVRVCHIPDILKEADIPFDKTLLPDIYWTCHDADLLLSYELLSDLADKIRLDRGGEEDSDPYKLPKWLLNEFTPSEITLFKHHFMMIDIDKGGSIDEEELQLLGESLGNPLTPEQAAHLIAEHDEDGSGSIDFEEFLTLMFKLMRGTVDVEGDALAHAMMESRAQIKIFEEIEDMRVNPPKFARVLHYGGHPVECEFLISGPRGSPYEGGKFVLKVIYLNGYPYQCPEVTIKTRIVHINFITLLNGSTWLPHLKLLWDSSWTSRDICDHVYELLESPNPGFLPVDMIKVYNSFIKENYEVEDDSVFIVSAFADRDEIMASDLSSEPRTLADMLRTMPRMSQMHVNIIVKFFTNSDNYDLLARQAVEAYATGPDDGGDESTVDTIAAESNH